MTTNTTIPVNVSAEAAAHLDQLGLRAAFNALVEKAKELLPGLRLIDVTLDYAPWMSDEPAVLLDFHRPHPGGDDGANDQFIQWTIAAIPPEQGRHFAWLNYYEPTAGR